MAISWWLEQLSLYMSESIVTHDWLSKLTQILIPLCISYVGSLLLLSCWFLPRFYLSGWFHENEAPLYNC